MNKSIVILAALTVAAATWYVGQRFYIDSSAGAPPAADQGSQADPAQLNAELDAAKAKEDADVAKLQALSKGQNAAALAAARLAVENAQSDLNAALEDEYTAAYDAVYNKTDVLFKNAKSSNPTINVPTASADIQASINAKRLQITALLDGWKASNAPIIAAYLVDLENIVASLTPTNSGLTQAQINDYNKTVGDAITQVDTTISTVATDQGNLNLANDELTLQQAAGDPDAINNAENAVNNDESNEAALEAQLAAEAAAAQAAANAAANSNSTSTGDTSDGSTGSGNAGNNPGSPSGSGNYSYGTGSVQQQQQQFQEIIKNGPPELLNF